MDVRRIGGLGATLARDVGSQADLRRNERNTDRDAQGHDGGQKPPQAQQLTPAQEEEALRKLQELPSFVKAGLKAVIVRDSDRPVHIAIMDIQGKIIQRVAYEQIVTLYLDRDGPDKQRGMLLRRAA